MNQQQSGIAFASLGVASLAVAGSFLFFIETLGGMSSYLGATLAIFLAMLCATRSAALHRAALATRPVAPAPVAVAKTTWRETSRSRLMSAKEASEDEVIESRMAALHAAVEEEDAPSTLPPQHFERTSFFAPVESMPESSSVVVIEEPLDPDLASQFAEFNPEQAVPEVSPSSVSLRQMDDIRAQIARLREESRVRHAANMARVRTPMPVAAYAEPAHAMAPDTDAARSDADPFARTEYSSLPGAQQAAGFARTEFSELPGAKQAHGFARTEFQTPAER